MSLTVEQIYREALKLSREAKAQLVDRLVDDVCIHIDPDIEREIVATAESRLDEVLSGKEEPVDGPTAMRAARRLVGK